MAFIPGSIADSTVVRPFRYLIAKLTAMIRVVGKFVFRQVPTGAASGYATIEKVEGNTVVWNQKVSNGNFVDFTGWNINNASYTITDNVLTMVSTTNTGRIYRSMSFTSGHKYLLSLKKVSADGIFNFVIFDGGTRVYTSPNMSETTTETYSFIYACANTGTLQIQPIRVQASGVTVSVTNIQIHDLTAIFGAGNEPSTVADFEAWMAQNIGTLPYFDYNAGELLSVKMSGMQTENSSQQTLDTIALDVTTITGINTATNVREVIFVDGMNKVSDNDVDIIDLTTDTAERATFVLPDTYQELEWLKTDGNAYIQTSLLVNRLYTYKLKFNVTDFNYGGWVLGARVSAAGNSDDFGVSTSAIRFGTQYVNKDFTTYNDVELIVNGVGYTINGENTEWSDTPTVTNDRALKLFWAQNSTAQKLGKIYYLQILDSNGVSLLHLIPAKRIADSVLGMYDVVSGTFFTNAGTGNFIAGANVYKAHALDIPITYTDLQDANGNPLNPRYKVEQGGTEQVLPVNTSTPTTVAPTLTTTYTKDVH